MKNLILSVIAVVLITASTYGQTTNVVTVTNIVTITNYATGVQLENGSGETNNTEKSDQWLTEITFGGSGITTSKGNTQFGIDFSFSIQPFKFPVWVEVTEGLSWQPTFAGSTDFDSSWAFNMYKEKLYLNLGWSGGAAYGRGYMTRTGPEIYLQWFFTDNVFAYAGLVGDAFVSQGPAGVRPNLGIGMSF